VVLLGNFVSFEVGSLCDYSFQQRDLEGASRKVGSDDGSLKVSTRAYSATVKLAGLKIPGEDVISQYAQFRIPVNLFHPKLAATLRGEFDAVGVEITDTFDFGGLDTIQWTRNRCLEMVGSHIESMLLYEGPVEVGICCRICGSLQVKRRA
jgi:hypothetical protein